MGIFLERGNKIIFLFYFVISLGTDQDQVLCS